MPPSSTPLTPATLAALTAPQSILTALHHRSKNQHRRSTWWRHASAFRRQVSRLAAELSGAFAAERGAGAGASRDAARRAVEAAARRRARREGARRSAEARVRFWRARCVARWWAAFAAVAADAQFAPLGLVLLGVLAEVCALVGVGDALGMEVGEGEMVQEEEVVVEEGEDVGIRVEREENSGMKHDSDEPTVHLEDDRTQMDDTELPVEEKRRRAEDRAELREPLKKPKTTKRRKINDAMDELFSGLL